jgi:hypothetical protein
VTKSRIVKRAALFTFRKVIDMNIEIELDGWCHGPLFAPIVKQRPLARPKGMQGTVRRRQERARMPRWADRKAIASLYRQARELTRVTGELWVVDHIVPLIGKYNGAHIVDGLHWEGNMRVVHWRENASKLNWSWPDMPVEQMEFSL